MVFITTLHNQAAVNKTIEMVAIYLRG